MSVLEHSAKFLPLRDFSDKIVHLRHQLWNPERLGDDLIHSSIEGSRYLLGASIGCDSDNWNVPTDCAVLLSLSYLPDTCQSIHGGHFELVTSVRLRGH